MGPVTVEHGEEPEPIKKSPSQLERELLASPTWEHRKEECKLAPFNPDGSEVKPQKFK